ncbi:MAG TPA: flavin reductase family protein [Solirubrobacteraceae bacterium]|jgi:flavin reductase (DIM6/NTAB) family NADH-FMN oxidoreductase RutF
MSSDAAKTFLKLAGSLDYPLYIVTAADGEQREGCVIGFASQTSFDPARFLACLSRANRTFRLAHDVDVLAVHLIPRDRRDLVELFGGETGDETDKFARCSWHVGPRGLPILDDCPSWFAGSICDRVDLGDHVGCLLDPFDARYVPDEVLYFQQVKDVDPGHPA